jgi:hypothetical protein
MKPKLFVAQTVFKDWPGLDLEVKNILTGPEEHEKFFSEMKSIVISEPRSLFGVRGSPPQNHVYVTECVGKFGDYSAGEASCYSLVRNCWEIHWPIVTLDVSVAARMK